MYYIISAILLIISAYSKAKMDVIANNSNIYIEIGWINKWKTVGIYNVPIPIKEKPWYYLKLYKPLFTEKFPYSSTILVFLTDRWHLYQFFFLNSFIAAVMSLFIPYIGVWKAFYTGVIIAIGFKTVFEIIYKNLKQ